MNSDIQRTLPRLPDTGPLDQRHSNPTSRSALISEPSRSYISVAQTRQSRSQPQGAIVCPHNVAMIGRGAAVSLLALSPDALGRSNGQRGYSSFSSRSTSQLRLDGVVQSALAACPLPTCTELTLVSVRSWRLIRPYALDCNNDAGKRSHQIAVNVRRSIDGVRPAAEDFSNAGLASGRAANVSKVYGKAEL
jgi:hypothetical protein